MCMCSTPSVVPFRCHVESTTSCRHYLWYVCMYVCASYVRIICTSYLLVWNFRFLCFVCRRGFSEHFFCCGVGWIDGRVIWLRRTTVWVYIRMAAVLRHMHAACEMCPPFFCVEVLAIASLSASCISWNFLDNILPKPPFVLWFCVYIYLLWSPCCMHMVGYQEW